MKAYTPDEGFALELNDINDLPLFNEDGSAMTITILGSDSDVATQFDKDILTRRLAKVGSPTTGGNLEADGVAKLVKMTTSWNITPSQMIPGYDPNLGEGLVALTPAAATKFYGDRMFRIFRDAADRASAARANFLKG